MKIVVAMCGGTVLDSTGSPWCKICDSYLNFFFQYWSNWFGCLIYYIQVLFQAFSFGRWDILHPPSPLWVPYWVPLVSLVMGAINDDEQQHIQDSRWGHDNRRLGNWLRFGIGPRKASEFTMEIPVTWGKLVTLWNRPPCKPTMDIPVTSLRIGLGKLVATLFIIIIT